MLQRPNERLQHCPTHIYLPKLSSESVYVGKVVLDHSVQPTVEGFKQVGIDLHELVRFIETGDQSTRWNRALLGCALSLGRLHCVVEVEF
jgi:hypothetical protein